MLFVYDEYAVNLNEIKYVKKAPSEYQGIWYLVFTMRDGEKFNVPLKMADLDKDVSEILKENLLDK